MYITNNNKRYPCENVHDGGNSVSFFGCAGLPANVNGAIKLRSDDDFTLAGYNTADYLRAVIEGNTLILTNEPEPVPHVPTMDELRILGLKRIEGKCSAAIYAGVDIGSLHYNFAENAQINLSDIATLLAQGQKNFYYRADNETEQRLYTDVEMQVIIRKKNEWKAINTNYRELLEKWISRENDEVIISTINYGKQLPTDLMQILSERMSNIGVNLADYAGILT